MHSTTTARFPRKGSVRVVDIQTTLGMLDVESKRRHGFSEEGEEDEGEGDLVTINVSGEVFQT